MGYYSKRSAQGWLSKLLDEARRGELPGMVQTGATFTDAATEYMRWLEHDRQRKPSTLRDYQSIIRAHLLPAFGRERLEDITSESAERWSASLAASGRMNNRTRLKILTVLHGVMQRAKHVWKLPRNPISDRFSDVALRWRCSLPMRSWRWCESRDQSTMRRSI
jgi:hypothetical protein